MESIGKRIKITRNVGNNKFLFYTGTVISVNTEEMTFDFLDKFNERLTFRIDTIVFVEPIREGSS